MTELKQHVILVPIILQIMSSPTFIRQESLPCIKDAAHFLLLWRHVTSRQRFLLRSSPAGFCLPQLHIFALQLIEGALGADI